MLALDVSEARFAEVGWVLGYLDDIESDLSAFHRVDDMRSMDGPRFLRLATRTVAYDGVMRARSSALLDARRVPEREAAPTPEPETPRGRPGDVVKVIPPTREAIASSSLAGLIEMG